ncbi:hypothetical protein NC651_019676 [Populus alba x Populus x berolinensis]|nr:hypothetical protein NC651_019676 [Populus alba x Populus x berolinensis]
MRGSRTALVEHGAMACCFFPVLSCISVCHR